MENNWPETIDELLGECQRLIGKSDLYTLGERGEPFSGETEPRVDGTEYLAGEYQYGIAMIPAQWVTHVIEAATLGRQKAKAHPYGYEPDTGAFDVTRCECGCLNDISATYCNDCGGIIEVDMDAEKEIYKYSPHEVLVTKHDDGSLEFGGKRYVAAKPGGGKLTAEQVRDAVKCGANFDFGEFGEFVSRENWQAIADELNAALGGGECEWELEHSGTLYDKWRCSECKFLFVEPRCDQGYMDLVPNYCPNCGRKVKR